MLELGARMNTTAGVAGSLSNANLSFSTLYKGAVKGLVWKLDGESAREETEAVFGFLFFLFLDEDEDDGAYTCMLLCYVMVCLYVNKMISLSLFHGHAMIWS